MKLHSALLLALMLIPIATMAKPVDIDLLTTAICHIETRSYQKKNTQKSHRGARGWCQIMPSTAKDIWEREWGHDEATDPFKIEVLYQRRTSWFFAKAYLNICLRYRRWQTVRRLAYCYNQGHNTKSLDSAVGLWFAGEVEKEYQRMKARQMIARS